MRRVRASKRLINKCSIDTRQESRTPPHTEHTVHTVHTVHTRIESCRLTEQRPTLKTTTYVLPSRGKQSTICALRLLVTSREVGSQFTGRPYARDTARAQVKNNCPTPESSIDPRSQTGAPKGRFERYS